MKARLFTSEAVSPGHPDKVADQISDAVLDELLGGVSEDNREAHVRCACETLVRRNLVVVAGEWRSLAADLLPDGDRLEELVKQTLAGIGYGPGRVAGFDPEDAGFEVRGLMDAQSSEIATGVDAEQGAGDQGLMFGYATDEVRQLQRRRGLAPDGGEGGDAAGDGDALMPAPIHYARKLIQRHTQLRESGNYEWLLPDAKSQVTFTYDESGEPECISRIVFSTHHTEGGRGGNLQGLRDWVREELVHGVIPPQLRAPELDREDGVLVNPAGTFLHGGPAADCGLTGRKIIVDTYGGAARHGGGAFSGKDPTKVDRSAAYAARHIAKSIVAWGLAGRCEVQLAYAIGVADPVSVRVDSFGTHRQVSGDAELEELVHSHFGQELRPGDICRNLGLWRPIYRDTAAGGHFGRSGLPWENVDPSASPADLG